MFGAYKAYRNEWGGILTGKIPFSLVPSDWFLISLLSGLQVRDSTGEDLRSGPRPPDTDWSITSDINSVSVERLTRESLSPSLEPETSPRCVFDFAG